MISTHLWPQFPLQVLWGVTHSKNISFVTPDVNVVTVRDKPLVRFAVHDVECAPRSSSGDLPRAEKDPLQVPVLPSPPHKVDDVMIPIATGVKVGVRPIVNKVKPISRACHTLEVPHSMWTRILIQIDIASICAHVLLVVCLEKVIRRCVTQS